MLWMWLSAGAWAGDKDRDGVPNKTDTCKEESEDADGFQDEDGCPDPDNDADNIPDADDKCANEPEDKDLFQDTDGCPDPDNDGDGVSDPDDRCPAEKEDGQGPADGCPTVSVEMLMSEGYLPAIVDLMNLAIRAAGKNEAGCAELASGAEAWLTKHDPRALVEVWEARLGRVPEGFDPKPTVQLLRQNADAFKLVRPAFDVFCAEHAGWNAIAAKVDAVFQPIPAADPLPPPPKKKKGR
jgi:hypothetical protein